ncbi:hypothetical protein IGI04_036132 [Brassica rapa subsp. trilocularis]|uniref:Uncharacterized protein n=1 Tax=Brassica rapa subsp. trilocularis TaxID=1813537 RepID=A0ABQ7LDL3_BRACM|nr:hypothetical protein IGI04_036132 [Brassica rapa subsp. trilocularis]
MAAASYREVCRRQSCGGGRRRKRFPAVARGRNARSRLNPGGAYGFVCAPIAAWSVSTYSSRREEHDDGLACTIFATVREL